MTNPSLVRSQVAVGRGGQTTITGANTAQALIDLTYMVASANIYPDPNNVGGVLMSYGDGVEPYLPQLPLSAAPGTMYDLNKVRIKSTNSGDKVNWNGIISY